MFKKPGVNVIESDNGYSVEVLGRVGLLYTEGKKKMQLDSEVLNKSEIAVIKKSIIARDPPHDKELIDDNKRDSIMENIRRAFEFDNARIEVW